MKLFGKLFLSCLAAGTMAPALAQNTPTSQMEKISRGIIAVPSMNSTGEFVSWRLLGTDNASTTTFDVLRDGTTIASNLKNVTSYLDAGGSSSSKYQIVTRVNGVKTETSSSVTPWSGKYLTVKLSQPGSSYTPNDCSVGDVDGDGEYEIVVKWNPSTAKDNSQSGKTDAVFLDCYKFNGTRLWRIDLGYNIRAGAHYTQHLVYDFDGDGKAEVICKTAPLSKDGKGNYVTAAATDSSISGASQTNYRNSSGYILTGPEYLTVFNGATGAAIHTIYYNPNRAGGVGGSASMPSKSFWGDTYGNRCDRYLSAVAYLDGTSSTPSAVFCRGYYTRAYVWAVKFNGTTLSTKWLSASTSKTSMTVTNSSGTSTTKTYSSSTANRGSYTLYGNGNHNLSVADVNGDGYDEILYGSGALDHNGYLLYATGYGHGDAMHVGDFCPDRSGLEVFTVHEESPYGWDLHDAATGKILYYASGSSDNGRGLAGCFIEGTRGGQMMSSNDRQMRSCVDNSIASTKSTSLNFRIYWDGSPYDQFFDTSVSKFSNSSISTIFSPANYGSSVTCNSTKATPCLQADIFGDWREEIVMYDSSDGATLNIFTSTEETDYRVPCLMHDHVYRMGVAWQQAGYNQPPHLGYYLPDAVSSFAANSSITVSNSTSTTKSGTITWAFDAGTSGQSATVSSDLSGLVSTSTSKGGNLTYSGTKTVAGTTGTLIGVTQNLESSANSNNAITFNVKSASGYSFKATKVEFMVSRIGTDQGSLDAAWDDTSLVTGSKPTRNSTGYTTYSYTLSGSASTSWQALILNIYNLSTTKQFAIANVKVYGEVTSSSSAKENISRNFDDALTTDIESVETEEAADNAPYFQLNGVRISKENLEAGKVYIHKGKKVIAE